MKDKWLRLSVVLSLLAASACKTNEDFSEKTASFVAVTGSELFGNSNSFQLTLTKGWDMDTMETLK